MKRVMVVEMFGRKLIVKHHSGKDYEFRVYEVFPDLRNDRHLESFESFQEALEFIVKELYA